MRKGFTTHSIFFVNDILHLPRKSFVSRYLIVLTSFLISGLYHAAVTPEFPLKCAMYQFSHQIRTAGAIIFEDIASTLWHRIASTSKKAPKIQNDDQPINKDGYSSSKNITTSTDNVLRHRLNDKAEADSNASKPQENDTNRKHTLLTIPWASILFLAIGYIWTMAFQVWTASIMMYDTAQCCMIDAMKDYDFF
jgi:hypothetical protein